MDCQHQFCSSGATLLWHFEMLGGFRVLRGTQQIIRFRTQKTARLLAYLACYPQRSHTRDTLIEVLWPEANLDAGRNNLNVALNSLRRQLEPPGIRAGSVLITSRATVAIHAAVIQTDVAGFDSHLLAAAGASSPQQAEKELASAVEIYRGPLLPEMYEEWAASERRRLADAYLHALRQLTKVAVQSQQFEQAMTYVRRALAVDPLREETHRALMRLYVAVGRPAVALEQYHELKQALERALGAVASTATRELAEQIAAQLGVPTTAAVHNSAGASISPSSVSPGRQAADPAYSISQEPSSAVSVTKLPLQFNRFFGRAHEIERVQEWLESSEHRLVTLTGTGGAGKTRLAIEAAQRLRQSFPSGVWFIPLADVSDASQILDRIHDVLDLPFSFDNQPLEQIAEKFSALPALLVLDNLEQLGEAAPVVHRLLETIPDLRVLATTRQALDLAGEQELAVPPLPAPRASGMPEHLLEFASVQLFVDRAQARQADFQITRKNAGSIAALCNRLEGIPLAIELAAGWIKMLTPQQMLEQLDQCFEWLVSRRTDIPERHRTLRAVIDSSYRLLSPELQRFFAQLSIFRAGWTLEAAQAVCKEPDALTLLARLQHASLLVTEETDEVVGQTMRYRMLETLRTYAAELLTSEERKDLSQRHSDYYTWLVEEAQPGLSGRDQPLWLERLEAEHENLRAALSWCGHADVTGLQGLRLATAMGQFWTHRGYYAEGRDCLEHAITRCRSLEPHAALTSILQRAHTALGILYYRQSDYASAQLSYERAMETVRQTGPPSLEALLFKLMGNIAYDQGHFKVARELYEASRALFRNQEDRTSEAHLLDSLANVAHARGDYALARKLQEEALPLMRAAADSASLSVTLHNLGNTARALGDFDAAFAWLNESLATAREVGNKSTIAYNLCHLAEVAMHRSEFESATPLLQESLRLFYELGHKSMIAELFEAFAELAALQEDASRCARLWAAAAALREQIGAPLSASDRARLGQVIDQASETLGMDYAALCATGRALSLEQAYALALSRPSVIVNP